MQETQHTQQTATRTAQNKYIETTLICKSIEKHTIDMKHEKIFIKGNIGISPWNGRRQNPIWGLNQVHERQISL